MFLPAPGERDDGDPREDAAGHRREVRVHGYHRARAAGEGGGRGERSSSDPPILYEERGGSGAWSLRMSGGHRAGFQVSVFFFLSSPPLTSAHPKHEALAIILAGMTVPLPHVCPSGPPGMLLNLGADPGRCVPYDDAEALTDIRAYVRKVPSPTARAVRVRLRVSSRLMVSA